MRTTGKQRYGTLTTRMTVVTFLLLGRCVRSYFIVPILDNGGPSDYIMDKLILQTIRLHGTRGAICAQFFPRNVKANPTTALGQTLRLHGLRGAICGLYTLASAREKYILQSE